MNNLCDILLPPQLQVEPRALAAFAQDGEKVNAVRSLFQQVDVAFLRAATSLARPDLLFPRIFQIIVIEYSPGMYTASPGRGCTRYILQLMSVEEDECTGWLENNAAQRGSLFAALEKGYPFYFLRVDVFSQRAGKAVGHSNGVLINALQKTLLHYDPQVNPEGDPRKQERSRGTFAALQEFLAPLAPLEAQGLRWLSPLEESCPRTLQAQTGDNYCATWTALLLVLFLLHPHCDPSSLVAALPTAPADLRRLILSFMYFTYYNLLPSFYA